MPVRRPLPVVFFREDSGREPVKTWLRKLDHGDRKSIGRDIKTLQFGWPVGMPVARKMAAGLWELRSKASVGIARVFFTMHDGRIVLLHGYVKKTAKAPAKEIRIAQRRQRKLTSK